MSRRVVGMAESKECPPAVRLLKEDNRQHSHKMPTTPIMEHANGFAVSGGGKTIAPVASETDGKGWGRPVEAVVEPAESIEKLPDRCLQLIFSYLPAAQMLNVGRVCRRWKGIAYSPVLWSSMSFRVHHGGIQVTSPEQFAQMIGVRFTEMRLCELATDLITPIVLHELASRCPKLQYLTLDFSTAMQLHDFNDLQSFPSRLRSLTLCLSENIFLEGFLRKVYTFISSVQVLHIIGTYEKVEDEEEEVYETVNVFKLKQYLPNLTVVNLWGVPFIGDEHVDALSSNCAHLQCLCVNYCEKVTGSCLRLVIQRCRRLTTLLLAHTKLDNKTIQSLEWEKTNIEELDIRATELSDETLASLLTRLPHLRWLDASWLEQFTDQVLENWMQSGTIASMEFLSLDTCDSLTLNLGGHSKLLEYFWMGGIPRLNSVRVLAMGVAEDCCPKVKKESLSEFQIEKKLVYKF
uniref:F-box domain-containing protein n=1 Tax=Globodera pallida TaxID=36090 RepID=A0A183BZY2_GLOPA